MTSSRSDGPTAPALWALLRKAIQHGLAADPSGYLDRGDSADYLTNIVLATLAAAEAAPRYETFTANDGEVSIRAAEAAPLDVDWNVPVTTGVDADVSAYAAAPLDVEPDRLAMAMSLYYGDHSETGWQYEVEAAGIAREYAALRSPDTETAGEAG
jgi:hypothetical protein